ncbi:MAG: gamma-glutamyl-gamma-aminobutyrate hydrolase family protein [Methylotenera sp.]|nr:gamma-glutamyl-gamma-aminobutyrate hydrolase family protein [Oligoflexia bacterium]
MKPSEPKPFEPKPFENHLPVGPLPGRRLRIGISACFFHADPTRGVFKGKTLQYFEESLVHWVMSQGAVAYLIPSIPQGQSRQVTLPELVRDFDGLVLQGGSDVAPETYGETPLDPRWKGDAFRDQYEIELVREFMKTDRPVLGICRGAQLINVALGGTLFQDIEMQVPGAVNHRNWEIYDQNFHEATFAPGGQLSKLYGGLTRARINTIHHQAIKDLGRNLIIEARSDPDEIIEAIRLDPAHSDGRYVFAAQWHPEFQDPHDTRLLSSAPILTEFLQEVSKRVGARGVVPLHSSSPAFSRL